MKILRVIFFLLFFFFIFSNNAFCGPLDTQTVNFDLQNVDSLGVSGNPGTLIINTATAGQDPNPAVDTSTTYSITTNGSNRKITGQITSGGNPPTGVTLRVQLDASGVGSYPSGGPPYTLTTTAVDLVSGITKIKASNKQITYTLQATTDASPQSGTWIVTITITS